MTSSLTKSVARSAGVVEAAETIDSLAANVKGFALRLVLACDYGLTAMRTYEVIENFLSGALQLLQPMIKVFCLHISDTQDIRQP